MNITVYCRAPANNRDPSCIGCLEKKGLVFQCLDRGMITTLGLLESFLVLQGKVGEGLKQATKRQLCLQALITRKNCCGERCLCVQNCKWTGIMHEIHRYLGLTPRASRVTCVPLLAGCYGCLALYVHKMLVLQAASLSVPPNGVSENQTPQNTVCC